MNFESILYELLTESVEDVNKIYEKYYSSIPRNRFNAIAKTDKFTKVDENGEIDKLGKLARFLLTLFKKGGFHIEDLSLAKEYIDVINKRNVVIPWDKINTLPDIYPYIKKYLAQDTQSFKDILQFVEEGEDYKIVHDGHEYVIYQPLTEKGAVYLGVGAEWCTTWGPLSLNPRNKDRANRFRTYSEVSPIYIIAEKTDLDKRVQFWFKQTDLSSSQFKNLANGDVNPKDYFYNKELFDFFFPINEDTTLEQLKIYNSRRMFLPRDKELYVNSIYKEKLKEERGDDATSLEIDSDFDEDVYMTMVTDKNVESIDYWENKDEVRFKLRKLDGNARQLSEYLNTLENSKNNYPSQLWGGDGFEYDLEEILERFYDTENELIVSLVGDKLGGSWNDFKKRYLESFVEKFSDQYTEKFDEINYSNVDSIYDNQIEHVTKNVHVLHNDSICFNVDKYNDFIRDNHDIDVIDDFDNFLTEFLDFCDVNIEDYDFETDFSWDYPYYGQFESAINEWFTEPFTQEMLDTRDRLRDILNKYFQYNTYRDQYKEMSVNDDKIDYLNQSVEVDYLDRQKNKSYTGYVLIDNLPKYVTMNMIAESSKPVHQRPQVSTEVIDWGYGVEDNSDYYYTLKLKVNLVIHNKNISYILHLGANVNDDEDYEEEEGPLDPNVDWQILSKGNYVLTDNQEVKREIDENMVWELIHDLNLEYSIDQSFLTLHERGY